MCVRPRPTGCRSVSSTVSTSSTAPPTCPTSETSARYSCETPTNVSGSARNARDFFDRYLHRRQLAPSYYLAQKSPMLPRRPAPSRPTVSRRVPRASERLALDEALASHFGGRLATRPARRFVFRLAAAFVLLFTLFVAVPEMLGDHPYDPRPSSWFHATSRGQQASPALRGYGAPQDEASLWAQPRPLVRSPRRA